MEDKNSDQPQNLVEKIPALDMILSVPTDGSQPPDQVGANNPCFIMCIDASGRLLRIPMSVLQKQVTTSINKVTENHDKQKAPVATITPWITPSQNSQGIMASQLHQSSISLSRHQQMNSQQLFVDQTRQLNPNIHINQQLTANQDQVVQKLQLIGSQQNLVDKLQIFMQKHPISNLHLNVKNLPLSNHQFNQKPQIDQSSNLQQLNSNQCSSLQPQQAFTKQHPAQQINPINQQSGNNLLVANKHKEINNLSLQRHSFSEAAGQQISTKTSNAPTSLNLFAVLQNNKIFQNKGSLQFLDQISSPVQKLITIEQPQQAQHGSSIVAKDEQSLQAHQNWSNLQLFQHDSKNDSSPPLRQNLVDINLSSDKNVILENINGKSVLSVNNIQLKNVGGKVDLANRLQSQCIPNELSSHILSSQHVDILQPPSKASFLISSSGNVSLKAGVPTHPNFHVQSELFQKDQIHLTQKTDLSHNRNINQIKSDKLLESQLIFLENKGASLFQFQSPKCATLPMTPTSVNVHISNRSLTPSFYTVTPPQVQFSSANLPLPHQISHTNNQIIKAGEGLKQVGNVQAIVIPNNINLNTLQLPQINGLPLSNLSSFHIISSSGLNHDQVLLLSSHSSQRAQTTMVQTCPISSVKQVGNQTMPTGKQPQTPFVFVQNPVLRANQDYSRQLKNIEPVETQTSCSFKSQASGPLIHEVNQNSMNPPHPTVQSPTRNSTQFVIGQEYQLSYPNGLQVVAVWDGKYFRVKNPANANVTPVKTQVSNQDKIDAKLQFPTQLKGNENVSNGNYPDDQQAVHASKMEDQNFMICKICGRMSLNREICNSCNQSYLSDNIPNKKIKLTNEVSLSTQLSLNKIPDGKRNQKLSKKFSSASPKKDAEIVHILSSDDEESHSSSWDDSSKTPSSPASSSAICPSSSSIPFSGFRVNIKNIFFGKISCDWMNTLTFDGKSVNLLSDSCSASYCLSACGSEVMLVAAYFDTNKRCTYLFLQVNHSSAIKLFDRIFVNSKSLYDPHSIDDCAKYIVLFLDDIQSNLMEVIPRVVESMQLSNGASHPVYKTIEKFEVAAFLKSVKLSGDPVLQKESVIINRKCQEEDGDDTHPLDQSFVPTHGKIINMFTYPPPPATGGITVSNEDLFCLNEGEFLNDVIIDFYFKYLSSELLAERFTNSHVFSSFFYRRLTRKVQKKSDEDGFSNMSLQQRRHAHVKTWTRHVDLFSKDFIVVPINESAHWFLAIICYPGLMAIEYATKPIEGKALGVEKLNKTKGKRVKSQIKNIITTKLPCILVFDSLSGPSRSGVIKLIRDYLQVEWDLKKKPEFGGRHFNKDTLKGAVPECPQQTNFSDCGIYILQYVESFFTDPITDYTFPIKHPLNWFDERRVCNKRAELQQLILELQKAHNPCLDFNPDQNGCIIKNHNPEIPDISHISTRNDSLISQN